MRIKIGITVLACMLSVGLQAYSQEIWVGKDGNIRNTDARAMVIDQGGMYLATKSELYHAKDVKEKWESVFSLPSGENEVTSLGGRGANIFVGTKRGLFRSQDYGKSWRNVFKTIMPDKNNVLCIEVSRYNPGRVVIATAKGVFLSEDSGDSWKDISGALNNRSIINITLNKEAMYACAEDGLYFKKDAASDWDRIYVLSALEKNTEEGPEEPVEAEESGRAIKCVALKDSRLYIAVHKRLLYSDDAGKSWNAFSSEGLSGTINYIAISRRSGRIYSATTKGVFEFSQDRSKWLELYKGMDKAFNVSKIIFEVENEDSLWALTDRGIYRLEAGKYLADQYIDVEKKLKNIKIVFDNEPTYKELQQAALKFGEVNPDKIKKWRDQARLKAFMPKISLGKYIHTSTNAEIYTSATRDYVTVGPDDISNGLDVSASWDLGSLVWSQNQNIHVWNGRGLGIKQGS